MVFSATTTKADKRASTIALAVVNGVGIAVYLYLSSKTWLPPQERGQGLPVAGGDSIYWVMTVLLFFLLNVAWIIYRATRKSEDGSKRLVMPFGLIGLFWIAVVLFDHHMQS
jgi:cbb3-type cytochrome oxidase subunit 3